MKPTPMITHPLLRLGLFSLLAVPAIAQTAWIGGTDLSWSTAANWSPASAPTTGGTALLGNTGAARTVVYDSAASGALGTLTFTQTSAFLNALDIQKSLTVTNAITLAASGGGTSQISVSPSSANLNFTATGGIDIQSGGKLVLNFGANTTTVSYASTVTGNVTVSGGTLALGTMPALETSGAVSGIITGNLTISNGSIVIDNSIGDVRLQVNGNFIATGGSLTSGSGKGLLSLNGATNTMSNFTMTSTYGIQLGASGDQSLTGLPTTTGLLYLRGSGTKTVGSSGSTVGSINFINLNTDGTLVALKLATDLTQASGTAILQLANGAASGANTSLGVDANGHTLDMTLATATSSAKGTNGEWKPNYTGSATGVTWALSSSAANGVIKAKGFDFTAANVTVTVGANLTLESVGGTNIANNLGSGAALDPASTFKYSGSGTATLASGRSIGSLLVSSGTLAITGSTFNAAGGITVASGAVLDFSSQTVSSTALTLSLGGSSAGQVKTASTYNYNTNLTFNITSTPTVGVFDLFNGTMTGSGTSPTSVALSGLYGAISLTAGSGVWTGTASGYAFSFSEATGDLTISASSIPEPSTYAMLVGIMGLALAFTRSKCRG